MRKQFIIQEENGEQMGKRNGYDRYEDAAHAAKVASEIEQVSEIQVIDTWDTSRIEARFFDGVEL